LDAVASSSFRKFGLDLVGDVPWGTHLCQLYQNKHDILDVLCPYFTAGLRDNESCLWLVSSPFTVKAAARHLKKILPDFTRYFKQGQLTVCSSTEWYCSEDKIGKEAIMQKWVEQEEKVLSEGFDGLRILCNLPSEIRFLPSRWAQMVDYENYVTSVFNQHKILAICAYPLKNCTGANVLDIAHSHVGTLTKRGKEWVLVEDAGKRKENEFKYQSIVQTSLDAFWIVDLNGNFLEVNSTFCDLTGYSRSDLLCMNIHDLEGVGATRGVMQRIDKVVSRGHDRYETRLLRKDNSLIDVEVSAQYIAAQNGGQIFVFAHNVTRRKRNEQAIKHNETLYRELADSITDCFVALDKDLRYVYWNKKSEKITGIKAKDAIGKPFFEVFQKDEGTVRVAEAYQKVLDTRKPLVFVDELTMNNRRVVVENHIYPSKIGVSIFTKDITQHRELQNKLSEYTQRLEDLVRKRTEKLKAAERLAAIGETAGMVGHDIRNPLQTISGELYLAKGDLMSLPDTAAKKSLSDSIQIIGEQMSYIGKIVADLQDYARTSLPCLEDVDLKKMVNDILSTMIVPPDVVFVVSVKKSFPKLRSDAGYLKRILINLIINAVQAMPRGGKLVLKATCNENTVFIQIKDTGEGISEEVKAKIFKPLFTTKPKGQGLGLAVVKKLTTALGGNIYFESKLGKGTCFTVELPLSLTTETSLLNTESVDSAASSF
jgi:PAS domain S-box-containing protein